MAFLFLNAISKVLRVIDLNVLPVTVLSKITKLLHCINLYICICTSNGLIVLIGNITRACNLSGSMTDESLWQALIDGEVKALESIYRREVDHLYSYAVRFTRDEATVMDAIQDTFEELWNKRKNVSEKVTIRPYLMTAVRRRVLYIMKNKKNYHEVSNFEIEFTEVDNREKQWIKSEEIKETHLKLHKSMEFLSARQKEALYLRFFQNLTYDDICIIMEINYQSVRNLISQALKRIKEEWK